MTNSGFEGLVACTMQERMAVLSDLLTDDRVDGFFPALANPLFRNGQVDESLLGAVDLVCDSSVFLYLYIQNRSVPSETAESLLIFPASLLFFLGWVRQYSSASEKNWPCGFQ